MKKNQKKFQCEILKTQTVTKLEISNCDNLKTQMDTKRKDSNFDKTQNSNCDKTHITTKFKKINT